MGSDESHFNVSVGSDGQSHKVVSTNHNLCEEKGEQKRYRTEVLPLTSLTPYREAKPAHTFESRRNSFLTRGGCASCLRVCLGARLLPQSYQYPNLSEGADRVGGQLREIKSATSVA